jgi:succinoglycan biosynthesis protein ExoA
MPIRNEEAHLEAAIASVRAQGYPGRMLIIVGLGPSTDRSQALADELSQSATDLLVIENPSGTTPSALNVAIRAGSAPVVVRVDGHSELPTDYLRQAVDILRRTGAVNVGGVQRPEPTTPFEQAVADATTSMLGTGGAAYRVGQMACSTDTVYLGVFDRSAIEAVGLFDETLIRNQDYELNIRLRTAGGVVWFDPTLSVGYRPRPTWARLARQYYEYGWWKSQVLRLHPSSLRLRQAIPPLGIMSVIVGLVVGLRWRPALVVPVAYISALTAAVRRSNAPLRAAAALVVTHCAWAGGLIRGFIARRSGRLQ